jgi:hypothetical protein
MVTAGVREEAALNNATEYLSMKYFDQLRNRLIAAFGPEHAALIEEMISAYVDRHDNDYDHKYREE